MAIAACTGGGAGAVRIGVGGGSDAVALTGPATVQVAPGGTLTVVAGEVDEGRAAGEDAGSAGEVDAGGDTAHEDAPITHAFVGGVGEDLPPLFAPAAGGLVPNPAVWGQCRGGSAAAAVAGCPIPPVDGPEAWDGRTYWSTGAMLPGEAREVPLAGEVATARLVCALHPDLSISIVGDDAALEPPGEPARVAAALAAAEALVADLREGEVLAGAVVDGAYVGRFLPAEIRINVDATVTWTAQGRAPVDVVFGEADLDLTHTAPADGLPEGDPLRWNGRGRLRSGFLSGDAGAGAVGSSWAVTFSRPGRYEYASRFGAGFTGAVVVEDS